MSLLMVGLDSTALNVALPTLGHDLHAGIAGLQWTVDAYTVAVASLLMLAGSMGDRFGRKRVFLIGLVVFAVGSLLCSLATSVGMLIGCRVIQAVGGSMLNPVAMSIVTNTFTEPRERAQAVGIWGAMFGASMALGPIVGGTLVSSVGWRAIFLVNLPVALVAILLTRRFVPDSRAPKPRAFDPAGQLLVIVLFGALTFGIIDGPHVGWSSPLIVSLLAAAALAVIGLVIVESRREAPLINPKFFRSVPFSASITISVAAFAAFGGFLFLNTLYLQSTRGLSPVAAGLYTLPIAIVTIVAAPLSGRIVGRRGPRLPLVLSGLAYIAGCALLTRLQVRTPIAVLFGAYVLIGLAFGLVNAPITNAAVSGMPRAQAGVAAAVATTSRQVGQALGVAIVGAIVSAGIAGDRPRISYDRALPGATHPVWWLMTAFGALIVGLGLLATSVRAGESGRRTAAALNPEALA